MSQKHFDSEVSVDDIELAPKLQPEKGPDAKVVDAVWGEISEDGPNYRNLGW